MPSVQVSGSQTATLTTEHTLTASTISAAGTYQLVVDAANLIDDERLTLRLYGQVTSGATTQLIYESEFVGAQSAPMLASVAVVSPHYMTSSLEQNGGTGRVFPWAVYAL